MKKALKNFIITMLIILAVILILHVLFAALLVAVGMGEYWPDEILKYDWCGGNRIQIWFCLMKQVLWNLLLWSGEEPPFLIILFNHFINWLKDSLLLF